MSWRRKLIGLVVGLSSCACTSAPAPQPARAFYYWRTTLAVSDAERQVLTALGVQKLYLRLFDVVPGAEGVPQVTTALRAESRGARSPELSQLPQAVPVVFLRNEAFARLPPGGEAALARLVWESVLSTLQAHAAATLPPITELQVDCDWTDSTRPRFFEFLRALRRLGPVNLQLSATIRLHQVKFRERTGVPPVDRGMLMFYNMGRFDSAEAERAIFDAAVAESYLQRLDEYPLPLDVALPIWSWTLQVRDEQVVGLLQSTDPAELAGLDFIAVRGEQRFEVTRTTFLHGQLLRQGDVLKGETLTETDLQSAAAMLTRHLGRSQQPRTVALFDLSERNLKRHAVNTLEAAFATVR